MMNTNKEKPEGLKWINKKYLESIAGEELIKDHGRIEKILKKTQIEKNVNYNRGLVDLSGSKGSQFSLEVEIYSKSQNDETENRLIYEISMAQSARQISDETGSRFSTPKVYGYDPKRLVIVKEHVKGKTLSEVISALDSAILNSDKQKNTKRSASLYDIKNSFLALIMNALSGWQYHIGRDIDTIKKNLTQNKQRFGKKERLDIPDVTKEDNAYFEEIFIGNLKKLSTNTKIKLGYILTEDNEKADPKARGVLNDIKRALHPIIKYIKDDEEKSLILWNPAPNDVLVLENSYISAAYSFISDNSKETPSMNIETLCNKIEKASKAMFLNLTDTRLGPEKWDLVFLMSNLGILRDESLSYLNHFLRNKYSEEPAKTTLNLAEHIKRLDCIWAYISLKNCADNPSLDQKLLYDLTCFRKSIELTSDLEELDGILGVFIYKIREDLRAKLKRA